MGEQISTVRGLPLAIAAAFNLSGCGDVSGSPSTSELNLADYEHSCKGGNRYKTICEGRYIIWDGEVRSIGDEYVRVRLTDDLTVDVRDIDPNEHTLVSGQKVRIRGRLADENIIFPDVSEGEIDLLETADDATRRSKEEQR